MWWLLTTRKIEFCRGGKSEQGVYIVGDKNCIVLPWPVWLSWLEHLPTTKKAWVWFLVEAHTYLGGGFDPRPGRNRRQSIGASLTSTFLSSPSSLSKSNEKKCTQMKIKNIFLVSVTKALLAWKSYFGWDSFYATVSELSENCVAHSTWIIVRPSFAMFSSCKNFS